MNLVDPITDAAAALGARFHDISQVTFFWHHLDFMPVVQGNTLADVLVQIKEVRSGLTPEQSLEFIIQSPREARKMARDGQGDFVWETVNRRHQEVKHLLDATQEACIGVVVTPDLNYKLRNLVHHFQMLDLTLRSLQTIRGPTT